MGSGDLVIWLIVLLYALFVALRLVILICWLSFEWFCRLLRFVDICFCCCFLTLCGLVYCLIILVSPVISFIADLDLTLVLLFC